MTFKSIIKKIFERPQVKPKEKAKNKNPPKAKEKNGSEPVKKGGVLGFLFGKRKVDHRKKPMLVHLFWMFFYFFIGIGITILTSLVVYGFYLDKTYRLSEASLSGAVWELPSRVYARPLELFKGKKLKLEDAVRELKMLGYQYDKSISQPGSYATEDNKILVNTTGFSFSDTVEPSRPIRLTFDSKKNIITEAVDIATEEKINIFRLNPLQIGSIYPSHQEDRLLIKLEDVPKFFTEALISLEDKRFYSHIGVDPKGILRAVYMYFKTGKVSQGGSTLTQQFVKNHYLTNERKLSRKIKEALLAIILESKVSKDKILEGYLNEIFLAQDGNRAIHGFGLASDFYFGKPLADLGLHQMALLLAMVQAPGITNPYAANDKAINRRNFILDQLVVNGLISQSDSDIAKSLPLDVMPKVEREKKDKYYSFISVVYKQLSEDYDKSQLSANLNIFTTLDPIIQENTEQTVEKSLSKLEKSKKLAENFLQTAAVIVDPNTAEVVAVVGDRDPEVKGFNRAVQAKRQIGSLIKPAVYLSALEHPFRYNLATVIDNSELTVNIDNYTSWKPKNYSKNESEPSVLLIDGLVRSMNIPTVRVSMDIGLDDIAQTIDRVSGFKIAKPYPSMVLGSEAMTPFEVAEMFETYANGGYRMPLRVIRELTDQNNNAIGRYQIQSIKAIDDLPYYLLVYAMQQIASRGTAASINSQFSSKLHLAGKTGTTNDYRDSWFSGFSGNYLTVVWIGNDDNKITKLSGSSGALVVWKDIMSSLPLEPFSISMPDAITEITVNKNTGELLSQECADTEEKITLPFIRGSEPITYSTCDVADDSWIYDSNNPDNSRPGVDFLNDNSHNNQVPDTIKHIFKTTDQ